MKAFPTTIENRTTYYKEGMDLRDYFAAKVLPILSKLDVDNFPNLDYEDIAEISYKYADAMMKAREKNE